MAAPLVYLFFPGNARQALKFYQDVFGGELQQYSFEDFNRDDGPAEFIAHSELNGVVSLAAADAVNGEPTVQISGMHLALLGTAEPATLHKWFDALAVGGRVADPLQVRPWGATDGQVVDQFGLRWLIGYEPAE